MPPTVDIPLEIQRRTASAVISDLHQELALWKQCASVAESRVAQLVQENEQLRAQVAALEEGIKELRKEVAGLKRASKRSAGPFSKNKRKHPRKRPGRKILVTLSLPIPAGLPAPLLTIEGERCAAADPG